MPITYKIEKGCEDKIEKINHAMEIISNSTGNAITFKESDSPDLKISCSFLENCYENKVERRWFWVVTTEAICQHEAGTAKIDKIKGDKIIQASINLVKIEKEDNCSENEIHEILHTFGYNHNDNPESIMFPEKAASFCNENIDENLIEDIINTYAVNQ